MTVRRGVLALALAAFAPAGAQAQGARQHGADQHGADQHGADQHGTIEVQAPWARAANAGRTTAAYLTLINAGSELDRLVGASSPAARAVELHTHLMEGGIARMRPVEAVEVNPGEPAVFNPGGLHLMLVGLTADLRPGQRITLTLRFEHAGEVVVEVPVGTAGASGPPHAHGG